MLRKPHAHNRKASAVTAFVLAHYWCSCSRSCIVSMSNLVRNDLICSLGAKGCTSKEVQNLLEHHIGVKLRCVDNKNLLCFVIMIW